MATNFPEQYWLVLTIGKQISEVLVELAEKKIVSMIQLSGVC